MRKEEIALQSVVYFYDKVNNSFQWQPYCWHMLKYWLLISRHKLTKSAQAFVAGSSQADYKRQLGHLLRLEPSKKDSQLS